MAGDFRGVDVAAPLKPRDVRSPVPAELRVECSGPAKTAPRTGAGRRHTGPFVRGRKLDVL